MSTLWMVVLMCLICLGKCAPPRTPDHLQDDINSIKYSINSQTAQMEKLHNAVLNNIEPKLSHVSTTLTSLTSDLHNLQERSHVWDTFQLYIASWNDQMSTADRKLDIISKGQEKLFALETKLNQLTSSGLDYKLENVLKKLTQQEDVVNAILNRIQRQQPVSDCLFGEFATRGILSSLKMIENQLNRTTNNETFVANDILTDVASKIDVMFDKLTKDYKLEDEDDDYSDQPRKANKLLLNEILKKLVIIENQSNNSIELIIEKLDKDNEISIQFAEQRNYIKNIISNNNCKEESRFKNTNSTNSGIVGGFHNKIYNNFFSNGTVWILIQKRDNYKTQQNFSVPWVDYKNGFGKVEESFWLGNDAIHDLTKYNAILRVELEDFDGNTAWAEYDQFSVGDENQDYVLKIGGYRGNASDSFSSHNGSRFSTYDRKNDMAPECCPCAASYGGGWWFNSCFETNLNGVYYMEPTRNNGHFMGIIWETWLGNYSLKKSSMMIRPIGPNDVTSSTSDDDLMENKTTTEETPYYEDP